MAEHLSSINADLQVNYQGEGKLHDELLFELGLQDVGGKSFRVHYRVTAAGRPIALAEIGVVCFNYQEKKPAPLPEVSFQSDCQLRSLTPHVLSFSNYLAI